jgi:hypothetical protein
MLFYLDVKNVSNFCISIQIIFPLLYIHFLLKIEVCKFILRMY